MCALLLADVAWAESDPNAGADPYYQLSPYRAYNTHAGYPYRSHFALINGVSVSAETGTISWLQVVSLVQKS